MITYEALRHVKGLAKGRSEARESEPVGPVEEAVVEATLEHLPDVVADMVSNLELILGIFLSVQYLVTDPDFTLARYRRNEISLISKYDSIPGPGMP